MTGDQRSVVLVTIDSLRADHCGYVPGTDPGVASTPTLDGMADGGTAFTTAVAPGPSTYESMPAVVTGRRMCAYPTGGGDEIDVRGRRIELNTRQRTIAEWFDDRGYETGAFTTNPYTAAHTNFARGFDHYEDFLDGGEGPLMRRAAHVPVLSEVKHVVTLLRGDRASKPWECYIDDVAAWLDRADDPYFLWVFLLDPHTPYLVPERFRERGRASMYYHNWQLWATKKWGLETDPDADALQDLYRGAVRSADGFLDALQSRLPDDPVVCVHADHGEAFGEHGSYGHESTLYEENVHVPLVVGGGPDRSIDRPVSLTAIPDLLRAAATRDLDAYLDAGEVALDAPNSSTDRQPGVGSPYAMARTFDAERVAVRGPGWKYVAETDGDRITSETVFDLEADPGERTDQSDDRPALVGACGRLVEHRLSHEREVRTVYTAAQEVDS